MWPSDRNVTFQSLSGSENLLQENVEKTNTPSARQLMLVSDLKVRWLYSNKKHDLIWRKVSFWFVWTLKGTFTVALNVYVCTLLTSFFFTMKTAYHLVRLYFQLPSYRQFYNPLFPRDGHPAPSYCMRWYDSSGSVSELRLLFLRFHDLLYSQLSQDKYY